MAPPRVHGLPMCHTLRASIAEPNLDLHGIILEVHGPVHLPLALAPDPGVCWELVLQAHHNQDPALGLMPAPEHVQKVAVLMCQFTLALHPLTHVLLQGNDDDTAAVGEEDVGHLDDEDTLSQGTVSLPDISASNSEDARKAIACKATHKSDVQYGNW